MGDPAAGDGRGPNHLAPGVVELVEPAEEQVGQPAGQGTGTRLRCSDQLLGEEGVALRALHDAADRMVGEGPRLQGTDEVTDVDVGQPTELETAHAGQPGPLDGRGAKGVAAVQVVGAARPSCSRLACTDSNRSARSMRSGGASRWPGR